MVGAAAGESTSSLDRQLRFLGRTKWAVVFALAVFEIAFDFLIEPWLRTTMFEENIEHYLAVVEVLAIAAIILGVFRRLETAQRELARRQTEVEDRYREASAWDAQLEALHEASVAMARESTHPEVLRQIVALAAQLSGARFGALAEFDSAQNVVEFVTFGVPDGVRESIGIPPTHRGLLRKLSRSSPVIIDDIADDPEFTGFPKGHPGLRTFLGVSIRWEGELLGHLYLGGRRDEQPFSESDGKLLEMFALQAAVVISRQRLLREVAHSVRSTEREQISMRLHDEALQQLYALGLNLDQARRRGLKALTDTMTVDVAVEAIQQSMRAIRGVLEAFDSEAQKSVEEALCQPARNMASFYGVEIRWIDIQAAGSLPEEVAQEVGACLAEAVANAARHGKAQHVVVRVVARDSKLVLSAEDDGSGLAPQPPEGHGLQNIGRRIGALGGSARLRASRQRGCVLELSLPKKRQGGP